MPRTIIITPMCNCMLPRVKMFDFIAEDLISGIRVQYRAFWPYRRKKVTSQPPS
ncbi:hypothetical protein M404DRAFT_995158 [Pisolithus tinctorius Marx 270]|uniref:Uncharacterized protein n=1 Tax=Pisolithus tinctorius Marx 270 TaxID=870435 RepID=A0A0C3PP48_PISTI|nr:hypothetical protein M404DRAFT_995158 [Pisolithus tinctorius Marx 270]